MAKANIPLLLFNRGEVSPLALARLDVERVQMSAERYVNWMPKTLGPMGIRAGLGYLGSTKSDAYSNWHPFVASTLDTALLEFTNAVMRVWVDDALLTIPSVSTTVSDGDLATGVGWTDDSTGDASIQFSSGTLRLRPTAAGAIARATQTVSVAVGDQNVRHSLKIVVPTNAGGPYNRPPRFRLGSSAGADDLIQETRLLPGEHHLEFTPPGANIYIDIFHSDRYCQQSRVNSIQIEAAGTLEVATPWSTDTQLDEIYAAQSADVVFVACQGVKQYRIERRSTYSWSVVEYQSDDGPFIGLTAPNVRLTPSETGVGGGTVTASRDFFTSAHAGAVMRLYHDGQNFDMELGENAQFTDPIRVSGVQQTNYNDREFGFTITGTWVGTLKTQRSITGPDTGFYEYPRDASAAVTVDITANAAYANEDMDDNLIAWYRMGFEDGDWTSGRANIAAAYKGGGDYGIIKLGAYISATQFSYTILRTLRGATATDNWSEGAWSEYQGYPSCAALYEGRLWWFGGTQLFGSVSDNFESFDQDLVGDRAPIVRTVGEGPVDQINFAVPLGRLLVGTAGGEFVVKSSSLDEPITPGNFSIKPVSSYGSYGPFPALRIDDRALFVQRSRRRLMEIAPASTPTGYNTTDLTIAHPTLLSAGVVSIAVQNQPDTRVHCVLADGTVAILTYNSAEEITCWSRFETDGDVERVVVLPGIEEDQVYYVVKRVINSVTKRYLEKWAKESEIVGGTVNKIMDSFYVYSGASTATISGLGHLEGKAVIVWSNGLCVEESDGDGGMRPRTFTVTAGAITLPAATTSAVIGLPFTAQWKSTKLAYAAQGGTALNQMKRMVNIGLVTYTTHHRGIKFGKDFTNMDVMSQKVEGADVATGTIHADYDSEPVSLPGGYGTDSRLCLQGQAPYPVTLLGLSLGVVVNEKG